MISLIKKDILDFKLHLSLLFFIRLSIKACIILGIYFFIVKNSFAALASIILTYVCLSLIYEVFSVHTFTHMHVKMRLRLMRKMIKTKQTEKYEEIVEWAVGHTRSLIEDNYINFICNIVMITAITVISCFYSIYFLIIPMIFAIIKKNSNDIKPFDDFLKWTNENKDITLDEYKNQFKKIEEPVMRNVNDYSFVLRLIIYLLGFIVIQDKNVLCLLVVYSEVVVWGINQNFNIFNMGKYKDISALKI